MKRLLPTLQRFLQSRNVEPKTRNYEFIIDGDLRKNVAKTRKNMLTLHISFRPRDLAALDFTRPRDFRSEGPFLPTLHDSVFADIQFADVAAVFRVVLFSLLFVLCCWFICSVELL